ncbi:MAG: TrkA family potassium uptake protein [Chloroflexi bacterium]|nr:TrkA family potassium uptake protein [Chloroflexota bacterium]
MKQQIAVIGLGRFGAAVAEELVKSGHEVLGVDSDLSVVQGLSTRLTHVVQAEASDREALQRLGIAEFDVVIIAITEDLETSILATLEVKRLGVANVIAKARNDTHGEILERVGADRVVYPERDTGVRLAHSWSSRNITDSLDIVEGYTVSRVLVPKSLSGRTLAETFGEGAQGVSLLLFARGSRVAVFPSPEERLQAGDVLVLAGQLSDIERFFAALEPAAAAR